MFLNPKSTVLALAVVLAGCQRDHPEKPGLLTTAAQVQGLSREAALARPPVRIAGKIAYLDVYTRTAFVEDETAAVWVVLNPESFAPNPGARVVVQGYATALGPDRAVIFPELKAVEYGTTAAARAATVDDLRRVPRDFRRARMHIRIVEVLPSQDARMRWRARGPGGMVELVLIHMPRNYARIVAGQEFNVEGVAEPASRASSSAGLPVMLVDRFPMEPLATAAVQRTPLTTVGQVKRLSPAEAERGYAVDLRGVITGSVPATYMLTLQDASGAIYVNAYAAEGVGYPPVGTQVRLLGRTRPGDFAPIVAPDRLICVGRSAVPRPVNLRFPEINDGRLDNRWVRFRGAVRSLVLAASGEGEMAVANEHFRTVVTFQSVSPEQAARLQPGTPVELEGIYKAHNDPLHHWTNFQVFVPRLDAVRVSAEPVAAARRVAVSHALGSLFTYGAPTSPMQPVRVSGVVTLANPDGSLYLSDGAGGIQVIPVPGQARVRPGAALEVTGFLPNDPLQRRIEDAVWRVTGAAALPEAPVIVAENAIDGSQESRWVRVDGRLTHRQPGVENDLLVLQAGTALVHVYHSEATDRVWEALRIGSLLQVKGVILPARDRTGFAGSRTISMLVGSSRDIEVVKAASWWTAEHLAGTLIAVALSLLGLLVVALALMRRVRYQARLLGRRFEIEEQLRQQAQAASTAKSEFLASMSHEIRTPMNGICGLTELAIQCSGQPEQAVYLSNVRESAQSLLAILNDVLDLAKVEAGKMGLAPEPFAIGDLLNPILTMASYQCEAKGLRLVCECSANLPERACGDLVRLRQILNNLVSNACKFTHSGQISVTAWAEEPGAEQFWLRLRVQDSGIGIEPGQLSRIFESFEQADRSDRRRYEGTGLGLSICLKLVRLMNGEIHVASTPGAGSTFDVRVPLGYAAVEAAPAAEPVEGAGSAPQPERARALRILAAEDNRVNRLLLRAILERAGHQAVFAENGRRALELWAGGGFDIILMDLQMPEMSGLEAARAIRERENGSGRRIPIVAVTARAMQEDRQMTLEAGMDGYIAKPYSAEEVLAEVVRFCKAAAAESEMRGAAGAGNPGPGQAADQLVRV